MIRMSMGKKNPVQPFNPCPEGLKPEVRPRVYDEAFSSRPLDEQGCPQTGIFRVSGGTYRTAAAYYGDTV
jgi:hypothetical protein